jgi:hypothetical protein
MVRLRLPHPGWLILIALIAVVSGTAFHYWWEYRNVQRLVNDVHAINGTIGLGYDAPDWLVKWLVARGHEHRIKWLKTNPIYIDLQEKKSVNDEWLERIKSFKSLEELTLNHTEITDAGVVKLKGLTNLLVLNLNDTSIGDVGVESLSSLRKLGWLSLARTHVSDRGLDSLKTLPQLKSLQISETKITEASLGTLEAFRGLESVSLHDNRVSVPAILRLKARRPHLRVNF